MGLWIFENLYLEGSVRDFLIDTVSSAKLNRIKETFKKTMCKGPEKIFFGLQLRIVLGTVLWYFEKNESFGKNIVEKKSKIMFRCKIIFFFFNLKILHEGKAPVQIIFLKI